MNLGRTFATTGRVLGHLRRDHRTLGLILIMPTIVMIILRYVFDGQPFIYANTAPIMLGIIPFLLMFIVTSVAVLRERTSGTLERLLISPASRLDILFGYAIAFMLLAAIQATVASLVVTELFAINIAGGTGLLIALAVLSGIMGMAFGLFFSTFARNEFQAVQFMPAFFLPQFLTCGLFISRDQMAKPLEYFSNITPVAYIVDALQHVTRNPEWSGDLTRDFMIITGFIIAALILGAASLRSR